MHVVRKRLRRAGLMWASAGYRYRLALLSISPRSLLKAAAATAADICLPTKH
jgi:hypothetical protein